MSQIALELKIQAMVEGMAQFAKLAAELRGTGTAAKEASGDSVEAAKKTQDAYQTLGRRAFADVRAEIVRVVAAYKTLADSGTLSANEQIAVANSTKNKLAELKTEMQGVAPATTEVSRSMSGLNSVVAPLIAGVVSLGTAIAGIKKASEAAIELDRMQNALKATIGSAEGAQKEYAFVRAESDRLGLSLQNSAKDYTGLTAATKGTNLAGQQTRAIFTAVAEASTVLGLSADNTSGALLAIQQMVSKGTVSAEELRGQLGERLPGAFQIAARAMGVTTVELGKMLEAGTVTSDVFLPKFAAELKKTFSDGLPDAVKSASSEFQRLQNTIFETAAAVGQSGLNKGLAEAASILRDKLADPAVQQSLKSLGKDIGDIAIAAAKMVSELKVIGEVVIGGAIFSKLTSGAVASGTAALEAGKSVGILRLALMGLSAALPIIAGLTILYQVAQAGAKALAEYAEAHRKLSVVEQQRVTTLRAEMAQLQLNITANKKYADVQILSAQEFLKLNAPQLAAYREQLKAKQQLELAEYGLALRKQELEKLLVQEATSTGKSKDMILLHTEAQKKAGEEAEVLVGKARTTRDALVELDKGSAQATAGLKDGLTPAAGKLVAAFDAAIAKSPEVASALKAVFEGFNPNNLESVKALLDALDNIGKQGKASALEVRTAFEKELKNLDYSGLLQLQIVLEATGRGGTVAAGQVVIALGKVTEAAREAADMFARQSRQAADASKAQVTAAQAHLGVIKADIEVSRAKLDVTVKQNAYSRDGTELAKQELALAKTNLELAVQKAKEAKLQYDVAVKAKEVLINQQRQMNAEIDIELHRGDALYVQKAKQAQANTAQAQEALKVATTEANMQEEIVLQLEEQSTQQKFLVDQARITAEETKKIKDNMDGTAAATGKAASNMQNLASAASQAQSPNNSGQSRSPSANQNGQASGDQYVGGTSETVESLTKKFVDAGVDSYNAYFKALNLVNQQLYVDVDAEVKKAAAAIKTNSVSGLSTALAGQGGTGGFDSDGKGGSGIGGFSEARGQSLLMSLLQQLPAQASALPQINPSQAAAPSKTIQVNFFDTAGREVAMSTDAGNEQTLLDMLKRAKGVAT